MSYSYGSTIIETEADAVHMAVEDYCYAGGCNSEAEIASWDAKEAAADFLDDMPIIEMCPIPYIDEETTPAINISADDYDIEGMIQDIIDECIEECESCT